MRAPSCPPEYRDPFEGGDIVANDPEAWNPKDPDYRRGQKQGSVEKKTTDKLDKHDRKSGK